MTEHLDQGPTGSQQTNKEAAVYAALAGAPPMPSGERMVPREARETARAQRVAQEAWLERREIELGDVTRLVMTRQEFDLLRNVGLGDGGAMTSLLVSNTKASYAIPSDAQYVSVDIAADGASPAYATRVVRVDEEHFGAVVDQAWLDSQGIDPGSLPHVPMTSERELGLLQIIGREDSGTPSLVEVARDLCGVPRDDQNDQYAPQYALIEIESGDPNLPNESLLVDFTERQFGTVINVNEDAQYFSNPGPDGPLTPESGGTYVTVDLEENGTFDRADQWLNTFTKEFVGEGTVDPFTGIEGDIRVRAGGIGADQKDAYVWENGRPFTSAVELTIAFPSQYNSVCIVVGDRRDPGNGKAGMAQVFARAGETEVAVILKIEGNDLTRLKQAYHELYGVPDFALSEAQRRRRDEQFNSIIQRISAAARRNRTREIDKAQRRSARSRPKLREHEIPLP